MPDRLPSRRPSASHRGLTERLGRLPVGPVPIDSGTAEVLVDPSDPGSVTLMLNGVESSCLHLEDPLLLEFEYMQQMSVLLDDLLERQPAPRVLHLGAAGCAIARWINARSPDARQVAVELDGELARLVRIWFDLPRSPALRLRVGEARATLRASADASFDVVVRDAYVGVLVPEHLQTTGAAADVHRVLAPGGLYLANCADSPPLPLVRAEVAALRSVFAHVTVVAEPAVLRGRRYGNVVLAATDGPAPEGAQIERALRTLPAPARLVPDAEAVAFAAGATAPADPPPPTQP